MRPLPPAPWRGFTIDDIDRVDEVIAVIKKLPFRPICRVVIDYPERKPAEYRAPVIRLAAVCDVMIQVRDSYAEKVDSLSVAAYVDLFEALFISLNEYVALYEIGNEVNGDWLPNDIADKVRRCYETAKALQVVAAVTFYLERAGEMARWAFANGIQCDVALISWYRRANRGFDPNWELEAQALLSATGASHVGGGEFGTEDENGDQQLTAGATAAAVRTGNAAAPQHPSSWWVGGWFFWDFCKWCLQSNGRVWQAWVSSFPKQ